MGYIRFPLVTVSPTFVAGSDQKAPELRVQSIRGQLRFWYRAYLGALHANTEDVYREESKLFGNTGQASAVTVQIRNVDTDVRKFRPVPHSSQRRFTSNALDIDTEFELRYILPPSVSYPQDLSHVTSLFLLLGGVGRRSRRMMGSVQLDEKPRKKALEMDEITMPEWWRNWEAIQKRPMFEKVVSIVLEIAFSQKSPLASISEPAHPTLHPRYSRILVAGKGYESAEEANIAFFGVIRKEKYRREESMFGYAARDRHASPVIAQVRRFGDAYYPVITAMRSSTMRKGSWFIVDEALDEIKQIMDCQEVWGKGRLA